MREYETFSHKPISRGILSSKDSHLRSNELDVFKYNDVNTNMDDRWSVKLMIFFFLPPEFYAHYTTSEKKKNVKRHATPTAKLIFFTASLFNENKKDNYIFIFFSSSSFSVSYLFNFRKRKNILSIS